MNLTEIESTVAALDLDQGAGLIFDLLVAYGLPKAAVSRLRTGDYNKAQGPSEQLWKNRIYDVYVDGDDRAELHIRIERARNSELVTKATPRFLIARNRSRFVAYDRNTADSLDVALDDLAAHAAFLMPLAGVEKSQLENLNFADIKASAKMATLYDEIIAHNDIGDDQDAVKNLNTFFSRLLFCFFAEDTGVFPDGIFTNTVADRTSVDGSDTAALLDQLFAVLDVDHPNRDTELAEFFSGFGYVNGSLFATRVAAPQFSAKARRIILECGTLDWSQINPDIFGSMIQAVVNPDQRSGLGMHYTSVENIMRVLRPLFLDRLSHRFDAANTVAKLDALHDDLTKIKVFDPACGSGNFLVIAYKEMRKVEHQILQRLASLDSARAALFAESRISLSQFYGIEIDDFAHDIATLSLWLAKHQMNVEFKDLFGAEIPLIPLTDSGEICHANAARVDWQEACPDSDANTYVCGNPPYLGSKLQKAEHKDDFRAYFAGEKYPGTLDYISLWFLKGVDFINQTGAELGFVSTNSICQGDHVGLLWPKIYESGAQISFARTSFLWSNNAKGSAGVTCVVIGLSTSPPKQRRLVDGDFTTEVPNINPYLVASPDNTIVMKRTTPITDRPPMAFGSRPIDDGNLLLNQTERDAIESDTPSVAGLLRPFIGSREFIQGQARFCIWIEENELPLIEKSPEVAERVQRVRAYRTASTGRDTPKWADRPHRFIYINHQDVPALAIPKTSSRNRPYVPMGFLPADAVASDALFVAYGAEPWVFSLLTSKVHMAWVQAVAGRMKSDYRYSNTLVYNTFPFPNLNDSAKKRLKSLAFGLLGAREQFPGRSLADLYDPEKMPEVLRQAHADNDEAVDALYRRRGFASDAERLEVLLAMYTELVSEEER